jgi:VWFA-related protein
MRRRPENSVAPLHETCVPLLTGRKLRARRRLAVLALPLAGLLTAAAAAQIVREHVSVEVVTLTVTARDGAGRPIRDLRSSDLRLLVDGKPVAIDTLALETGLPAAAAAATGVPALTPAPGEVLSPVPAPSSSPLRPLEVAIIADEIDTKTTDRRDVYDELLRYLESPANGIRRFFVGRFSVGHLHTECPWTSDAEAARAAIQRLRDHPNIERIPTISEKNIDTRGDAVGITGLEIEMHRARLLTAVLEALAAFPDSSGRRELILVSGGTLLTRSTDLAVPSLGRPERGPRRPARESVDTARALDLQRETFELWSRATSTGRNRLDVPDVVAKAVERNIVLIPISAEAFGRGMNPGVEEKSPPRLEGLSLQLGAAQVMMEMAEDTGGEPVLLPRKTAARLTEIEERASYSVTFRDPGAGDHRSHRIELACSRPGIRLEYRRGYRISAPEERMLDQVFARFLQKPRESDPLNLSTSLSPALSKQGRSVTRLSVRYSPPIATGETGDRDVTLLAVGENAEGTRTEPIRWNGVARRLDTGDFEATLDLGVPPGSFNWSIALRDDSTRLVSFVLTAPGK